MARSSSVISPNLGLYYGLDPLMVPARGLQDGRNFRVKQGKLSNVNLGWQPHSAINFGNPIMLVETFFIRGTTQKQVIVTTLDVFEYDHETDVALLLNRRYDTGTVNSGGNDSFTKSLLHMNGADTSTTFTDDNAGGSAHTWTAAGNAQIDTAQSKFGGASGLFDGTGDYITTPDHADFTLGTSDFTIDFGVRFNASTTSQILVEHGVDVNNWWRIRVGSDSSLVFEVHVAGVTSTIVRSFLADFAATGTWYHVAIVRSGNVFKGYVNGVDTGGGSTNTISIANMSSDLRIGVQVVSGISDSLNGWMDEFRLSVGSARWTANFTPPTAAYLGGNTVLQGAGTAWSTQGIKAGDYIHIGDAAYRTWPGTWVQIASVQTDTQLTLVSNPGTVSGKAYTIRRTFTGGISDLWDCAVFTAPDDGAGGIGDDLFFLTNGLEFVQTWNGSDTQLVNRSALNFTCRYLQVYKNMMFYAYVTYLGDLLPNSFINSDVGLPLNAGDTGTGLSEQFRVHDGADPILDLEDMGDNLVFYSRRHVTLCQFVGDPLIFIFREAGEGIGPVSHRLIADFGDYHEFLGTDSQYLFDGVTLTRVNEHLWREVLRQRDASREHLGFCHFDEENGDLLWAVPLTSDAGVGDADAPPDEAFVEHYLEEVGDRTPTPFSRRQAPFVCSGYGTVLGALTWDEISETWDQMVIRWNDSQLFAAFPLNLMGSADGQLFKINTIQTGDGDALTSYVRFGRRALGDGRMRGFLQRIYPYLAKLNVLTQVRARIMDHALGPPTIIDEQDFDTTLNEGGHFSVHHRRGRFFEPEFGSEGDPWELSGYDTDVKSGGSR